MFLWRILLCYTNLLVCGQILSKNRYKTNIGFVALPPIILIALLSTTCFIYGFRIFQGPCTKYFFPLLPKILKTLEASYSSFIEKTGRLLLA